MIGTLVGAGSLAVDFTPYKTVAADKMRSRILSQFSNSIVMDQVLQCMAIELQELVDACVGTLQLRTLVDARGAQLDVIGRIVGQERILLDAAGRAWFGPDSVDPLLRPPDDPGASAWMYPVSLFGSLPADDTQYLGLIMSKIFKNHVQSGSVPELQVFAKLLTGENISFETVGPLEANLIVRADCPAHIAALLMRVINGDMDCSVKYLLPVAATTRIVEVVYLS